MGISDSDWSSCIGHLEATLDHFEVAPSELEQVLGFIDSTRAHIVES